MTYEANPEEVARSYDVWSNEGERNNSKTGAILGISESTVRYRRKAYGWDQQYLSAMAPEGENFANLARLRIREYLPQGIERMIACLEAERPLTDRHGKAVLDANGDPIMVPMVEPRDRGYMMKLLLEYGLEGTSGVVGTAIDVPSYRRGNGGADTPEGRREQASAILEATVSAVNTRKAKGGRV